MNNINLITPEISHKNLALEFRKEYFQSDIYTIYGSNGLDNLINYDTWLNQLNKYHKNETFFVAEKYNNHIIGIITFHKESDNLYVDYDVSPIERNKGYELEIIKEAVNHCKLLKTFNILFKCDEDNTNFSEAVIKYGGVLCEEAKDKMGILVQTYKIKIA